VAGEEIDIFATSELRAFGVAGLCGADLFLFLEAPFP